MLRSSCHHRGAGEWLLFNPSLTIVLTLALLVAGCGGRDGYAPTADARVAAPPQSHLRSALAAPPVETEGDGLPAQRAPLMNRTRSHIDPTEPFSPNYGAPPQADKSADSRWSPTTTQSKRVVMMKENDHAHLSNSVVSNADAKTPNEAKITRISVRDLPDDLPPDFRERLIVMNGLR